MKKIMLRELPDWPPFPGGATDGTPFSNADTVVINQLFPVMDSSVTFRGEGDDKPHSYHYKAPNEKAATEIHRVIAEHLGRTVGELAHFTIEV